MIVGYKIEQYLTGEQRGGVWTITTHRAVTELHATKGWRSVRHTRHVQRVRKIPTSRQWRDAHITTFEGVKKGLRRPRLLRGIRP